MSVLTATRTSSSATATRAPVLRAGVAAAVIASAATEAFTGVVRAAGVHLAAGDIGGSAKSVVEIGPGACTIMVVMCVAAGLALAGLLNRYAKTPAHTWRTTAYVLTVLSFVPDIFAGATATSTKLTLMTAHLIAAAIVIPLVSRSLKSHR
jgi:hypothetical protein